MVVEESGVCLTLLRGVSLVMVDESGVCWFRGVAGVSCFGGVVFCSDGVVFDSCVDVVVVGLNCGTISGVFGSTFLVVTLK